MDKPQTFLEADAEIRRAIDQIMLDNLPELPTILSESEEA